MQMAKINKTNACRILDQKGIAYELIPYEVDENDLGAQHIADQLGEDIDQVFKTLVLKGDKIGYFVCVIPGNDELDLKKTAKATGNKSCDLIPMKELLPLTGYIRGGCSPVGMKKQFPTFIHETCELFDYIYVSAGVRGLQFKLNPMDLIQVVDMTIADLTIFELGRNELHHPQIDFSRPARHPQPSRPSARNYAQLWQHLSVARRLSPRRYV